MTTSHFNPRAVASTQFRIPMTDHTIEGVKLENELLFRRLVILERLNIRFRVALEQATGQPWDTENTEDLQVDQIENIVAQNMCHGLHITIDEAKKRIKENKRLANGTQVERPEENTEKEEE